MQSIGVILKKFGAGTLETLKRLKYVFYILFHPFDGFFDLKNDPKRRTIAGSVILYVLLAFSHMFKRQLLGYLFVTSVYEQMHPNLLYEICIAVLPYLMWTISNWCFTSLMDGDGKLSDIFCATAFATFPLTLCNFIAVPLSNFLNLDSANIYNTVTSIGSIWTVIWIFLGMITTHQYSVKKGIGTAVLSIVGIAIIAFVAVLVVFLFSQVVGFIAQVFTEVSFRLSE